MSIHRWKWQIFVAAILISIAGGILAYVFRNRLSETTIVGHWQGYVLQSDGVVGHTTVVKVPLEFDLRPDGLVIRGQNMTNANYMVCDNALVFYNIRDRNAPSHPILWNARLIGDTLTLSDREPVAVLRRVH